MFPKIRSEKSAHPVNLATKEVLSRKFFVAQYSRGGGRGVSVTWQQIGRRVRRWEPVGRTDGRVMLGTVACCSRFGGGG